MSSRVAYYFAAFASMLLYTVKGQSTEAVKDCASADSSISDPNTEDIRQLIIEVQRMRVILTESLQEIKNLKDTIVYNRQSVDGYNKNQTQISWKLATVFGIDSGEGPYPLPSLNNWIIFMNRFDGSLNFKRNWVEYRNGFGNTVGGNFWLGNEIVYRLTNGFVYTLRIEVQTNPAEIWFNADYSTFSIDSEGNKYALRLSGFRGNAGDPLTNTSLLSTGYHGGMYFSTWDADNDRNAKRNCSQEYEAGWWFNDCYLSCLTCRFPFNFHWYSQDGWQTSGVLRAARMMMRSL